MANMLISSFKECGFCTLVRQESCIYHLYNNYLKLRGDCLALLPLYFRTIQPESPYAGLKELSFLVESQPTSINWLANKYPSNGYHTFISVQQVWSVFTSFGICWKWLRAYKLVPSSNLNHNLYLSCAKSPAVASCRNTNRFVNMFQLIGKLPGTTRAADEIVPAMLGQGRVQ